MKTVNGLILAAGFSSRMGAFKMELEIGGISMIERTVLNMRPFCDKVIIVCGYKKEKIIQLLDGYKNIEIVENDRYEMGMFSSVQAGLRMTDSDRVFIQPGDIPFITEGVFSILLDNTEDILIPVHRGRKGHPVLINRNIRDRILSEPEDSKLNELFHQYGFKTIEVLDRAINFDVDDIDDLKEAERYI